MTGQVSPARDLVEQLIAGFEVLSEEYRQLFTRHRDIEIKLSIAKEQYNDLRLRLPHAESLRKDDEFDDKLAAATAQLPSNTSDWTKLVSDNSRAGPKAGDILRSAEVAVEKLRNHISQRVEEGVKIWKGPSADEPDLLPPISENHADNGLAVERDFTTPGTPSRLGCPFASMAGKQLSNHAASVVSRYRSSAASKSSISRFTPQGRRSRRPSIEDPIRAETCGMEALAESSSPTASAAICPIRFLDQHKPEEVAQYFEKHKHELPRSHEICVKRYQSNAESIRQLDAKYGNLVSMIQGLGAKHQSMLPETPPLEGDGASDKPSVAKIQEWARTVSADLENSPEKGDGEVFEEDRQPHFDRPLKDIRVGESPSRPWGITVPPKFDRSASTTSSKAAEIADAKDSTKEGMAETEKNTAPRCPFRDHSNVDSEPNQHALSTPSVADGPRNNKQDATKQHIPPNAGTTSASPPQMLFTGPVFIGYPLDQALAVIQQGQQET
ncbi:MAG: hypothetical protein M1821_006145 [Bathelium mastoideum]|nr:MAG: hypothetical protein M1821_006145 [Bathelium mastoideum]KAI9686483.1 MAG: hypothetical protein M1822_003494 [Bathelium mastoideum]